MILVTGASGYLGSSFIKRFSEKYEFRTFSLQKNKIEMSIFEKVDTIIHCAALVHQKIKYSDNKYYEINVNYPLNLAKKAKENGVKQFVFISTIAVYGDDKKELTENTTCTPINSYGKSKLEAERELLKLNDENFKVSIIRPPMIYGKDAPGNIDSLVKLILKIRLLPFASIENKRSFISIQNLCNMINKVLIQKKSGIFLASDNESISTSQLIELIGNSLDKNIYLIKIPLFEFFLKLVKPNLHKRLYENLEIDNTLTKERLNFKNNLTIEEGISLMIKGEEK